MNALRRWFELLERMVREAKAGWSWERGLIVLLYLGAWAAALVAYSALRS